MAEYFWQQGQNQICSALAGAKLIQAYARLADSMHHEEFKSLST